MAENHVLETPVSFRAFAERYRNEKLLGIHGQEGRSGQLPADPVGTGTSPVGPAFLGEVAAGSSVPGPVADSSVIGRLRRKFGLGDNPAKRMKLYYRLQHLAERHGELVFAAISEAVCASAGKKHPGRYFSRAICCRLAELGLTAEGGCDGSVW